MTKRRARNLDDQAIERIIGILDGWSGKLSWDLLVDSIERYLGGGTRVRHSINMGESNLHTR